jgi:hypothetical protein
MNVRVFEDGGQVAGKFTAIHQDNMDRKGIGWLEEV